MRRLYGVSWAETILIAFGVVMLVLVWRSMRRPHPPTWAKARRRSEAKR